MMKPGGRMSIYFDDLQYLGRAQDFSRDPNWGGVLRVLNAWEGEPLLQGPNMIR
jgi:hypothetical protein